MIDVAHKISSFDEILIYERLHSLIYRLIESQINTLINNAVSGSQPTTDSIAGLKAALSALSDVVGDSSSGLVQKLDSLTTTVTELGSALTAGYTAAKSAYDDAVNAAATSKGLADTALTAYNTAKANVTNATTAATALEKANDYYAKAVQAKTDADMVVAKANTVTIAAAQTPSTLDDDALVTNGVTVAQAAASAQTAAVNAVIMANSNVNAATIVLSNATLDASNQVIVTFIDYSSAAAATQSDISADNTAKNAYDAAKVTFDNTPTLNNANALKTAATNFKTAADKAATTAQAAVDKATASTNSAATTTSTADDGIALTNKNTADSAKLTADGLVTTAAANLELATAYANVPVVQALAGVGTFETGFSVTAGAVVTVTVGTNTITVLDKFTKTTENGVDTYTANANAFDGSETTIAVSAVMQATVGEQTISSVAATIADLDIDTTAPVTPNAALTTDSGTADDDITNSGAITAPDNTESGATVEYRTKMGTGEFGNWGSYSAPATDGTKDGNYTVEVRQKDTAGNVSEVQEITFTLDTDADADTTDLSITIGENFETTNNTEKTAVAFTLAGIDSDAASVKVEFTDTATPTAGKVTVNATKDNDGSWTVGTADLSTLTDGTITATVTVTDTAGNTATASDTLTLAATAAKVTEVALTAENEATFTQLNAGDIVTATVTMDKAVTVTGTPTLTLVIGTAEVNATYDAINSTTTALKFNYAILAEQTDTDGISIKADGIVLGTDITIVDASGNNATLTFTAVAANGGYIVDTTVPTAVASITALSADTEADGTNGTDFITKTAEQTVSGTYTGTLATGEKIQVSVNGGTTWVETTANTANSTWTTATDAITLVTGASTVLSVRTIDAAGNVKGGLQDQGYTLDQTPPTVTVPAIDISADTGVSADDFNTKTALQTITATLSTDLGSDETLWGSVNGGTNWTNLTSSVSTTDGVTSVSWANATLSGSSSIKFEVRDAAGNAGTTATQTYVLDTINPEATVTLTKVTDNVGGITGNIFDANDRAAATDDTSLTLSGAITGTVDVAHGEAVMIYDTQSGTAIRLGTATINEAGTGWTFIESRSAETKLVNDYTANYSAVVEDLAGNQSTSQDNTFAATISTAPITSTAAITKVTDSESPVTDDIISSGAYTNDTIPVLSGSINLGSDGNNGTLTALPNGQVVAVYDGTTRLGNATVDTNNWTWTFTDDVSDGASGRKARLKDGDTANYTVVIENTDVGTQGTMSTPAFVLNIDTTVPSVAITSNVEAVKIGETATITFTFSEEPVGFTVEDVTVTGGTLSAFAVDSTDSKKYTAIFTPNVDTEASASITIAENTYTDAAANNGTAGTTPTLAIDTKAPTAPTAVTLTAVGGTVVTNTLNTTNTNLTATATIVSNEVTGGKAELYIGSALVATSTDLSDNTATFTAIANPSTNALQAAITAGGVVTVKLYDAAGNVTTSAVDNPTLTVDYMPPATPTVSLAHDTGITGDNTDLYTKDATLTISELESGATRSYTVDGGSASESYTKPTTQGSHTVTVTDTDAAGNVSIAGSITFTLDTVANAPTITGLTNDTGASGVSGATTDKTTKDMTLSLDGVEDGALVEYQVNGGDWLSESAYLALADGTYSVVVRQTDKAGNESQASSPLAGIVKDTLAPIAPTFAITDNGPVTTDGITSDANVAVSLAIDTAKWEYTLNGSTWNTGSGTAFSLGSSTATFAMGAIGVRA